MKTTCKNVADALGHDQAKTIGIPFTDQSFDEWLEKRNKTSSGKFDKYGERLSAYDLNNSTWLKGKK